MDTHLFTLITPPTSTVASLPLLCNTYSEDNSIHIFDLFVLDFIKELCLDSTLSNTPSLYTLS